MVAVFVKGNMKLEFELVPDSVWGSNLRTLLSKSAWDFLRKDAYERAGGKCRICGRSTNRLEAHEQWEYDEEFSVQKLVDILAVCKSCHSVIHIGRTQLMGGEERAQKHFCKVNGCSYAEYRIALGKANERHRRLNQVSEWKLDVSFLERYMENEKK